MWLRVCSNDHTPLTDMPYIIFFFKIKNCLEDDLFISCDDRTGKMLNNICISAVAMSLRWATCGLWASCFFCFFFCLSWWIIKGFWFNLYHSLGIFSRRQIDDIFLIFPRKQDLTFHANCLLRRQFAWNVISCFLRKIRKIFQNVVCWKFYPEC